MEKDELIQLLKDGQINEFNENRPYSEYFEDFTEVVLSDCEIANADFIKIDFNSATFADSTLTDVNFSNSDLTSSDFTRTTLERIDFNNATLNGVSFNNSVIVGGDFTDADVSGADFSEADLSNTDLSLCLNLSQSKFDDSTLWPEEDCLPDDFDTGYEEDLASMGDSEDHSPSEFDY